MRLIVSEPHRDRPIVASRVLRLDGKRPVSVRIWQPYRSSRDYVCQYEIRGLEEPKVGRALGVDTLQALLMTIAAIQNQLRVYRNRLSWAGSDDGDDGLPYAMVFASLLIRSCAKRLTPLSGGLNWRCAGAMKAGSKSDRPKQLNRSQTAGGRIEPPRALVTL